MSAGEEALKSVTFTGAEYRAFMDRIEKAERDAAESDAMNGRLAHENYHLEFANTALKARIEKLRASMEGIGGKASAIEDLADKALQQDASQSSGPSAGTPHED